MKRDRLVHLFAALTAVLLLAGSWRWGQIRPGAGRSSEAIAADTSHHSAMRPPVADVPSAPEVIRSAEAIAAEKAARDDASHDPASRHATGVFKHPLGKLFTIEGEAVYADKRGVQPAGVPNRFRVTAVDAKPLDKPRLIDVEDLSKLGAGRFRLEGYEYERWLGYEGSAIVQGFYPLFVPLKITRLK